MTQIIRSSRQASNIFGLGGAHAPRPKNLFYVSFARGSDTLSHTEGTLNSLAPFMGDLSFLVKSCDRPQIQPTTEELNQYNKKRIVHTGIKYSPIRITFYDTVDNLAMQFFSDYVTNYFGAFGHGDTPSDYLYDATISGSGSSTSNLSYMDTSGTGWGFAPTSATMTNSDVNSQFYFRSISLYEVWGNKYVQTDLINPRITAFDPEGLSFEDSGIGTISMTLAYEAVVYQNNGGAQTMTGSSGVAEVFASGQPYWGDTIDYPGGAPVTPTNDYTDYQFAASPQQQSPYVRSTTFSIPSQSVVDTPYVLATSEVPSGPLATYGDYVFGDGSTAYAIGTGNTQADLLNAALTNSSVAAALNATSTALSAPLTGAQTGVTVPVPTQTVASDQADVAVASIQALGGFPAGPDTSYYVQQLAAGAMSAANAFSSPREQIFTQNPAVAQSPNSWDSTTPPTNGVALSPAAYGAVNAKRPASAQIGFNTRTLGSQSG